jgi:hypothetical protein
MAIPSEPGTAATVAEKEPVPELISEPKSELEPAPDVEAAPAEPVAGKQSAFTVPDGGLEAWSVVLGGWLALFATFGYVNGAPPFPPFIRASLTASSAFGVYQAYYVNHLGLSDSAISWIGSFQLWLQFSMGVVVGRPFDEGHGRLLIFVGSIIYLFSCVHPSRFRRTR